MNKYQGIISNIKDKNRVEVIILPTAEGIPDVPSYINEALCHTPSDGSLIKIEATNNFANAKIGDVVTVEYKPPDVITNIFLLIGIPVSAAVGGFILKGLSVAGICFLLGLGVGGFLYKIIPHKTVSPIITGVIGQKDELARSICQSGKKERPSCQHCPLSFR